MNMTYKKNNDCTNLNNLPIHIKDKNWTPFINQFNENRLVLIENFFEKHFFDNLQQNILQIQESNRTNNLFKSIRRGSTIPSNSVTEFIKNIYYNKIFIQFLSKITNLSLENVNCDDNSNMNILVYEKPGDFITWHFDPNHYVGNRLTILISIINEASSGTLSSSLLQYKIKGSDQIHSIQMKPNSILIFDGSSVEHRATPIKSNERRIVLSFTYCNICKETIIGKFIKQCKEIVMDY
jgi:hypothetical protein